MKKMIPAMLLTALCMQAHALYITVNSPNGGETLARGEALTVNWVDNVSENVKIELLKNGTAVQTIANSTESDGNYQWQMPYDLAAGNDYKVKITSTLLASLTDQSNNPFTVKQGSVDLTYPAGGEALAKGSACNIVWNDDLNENVKIELFKNNSLERVIASSTESDGSFLWQVPSTGIEAASGYQVRISSTVTNLVTDQSGSFSITGGYIEGNVSGFWPKSGSPYIIGADVTVPANQTLTIEPGSEVLFNAPAQFTVQGRLLAQGTKDEKIRFAPQDTSKYWYGLNFEKSNADTSKVEYSEITGVKNDTWVKEFGEGEFKDIIATDDGGYIVVGSGVNNLVKFNSSNQIVWQKSLAKLACITKIGPDFLIGGYNLLIKINTNGDILYSKNIDINALDIIYVGDIYICGGADNESQSYNHDIGCFDAAGNNKWYKKLLYSGNYFNGLTFDSSITQLYAFGGGHNSGDAPRVAKISTNGELVWLKVYEWGRYKFLDHKKIGNSGNFMLISALNHDLILNIMSADGTLIVEKKYPQIKANSSSKGTFFANDHLMIRSESDYPSYSLSYSITIDDNCNILNYKENQIPKLYRLGDNCIINSTGQYIFSGARWEQSIAAYKKNLLQTDINCELFKSTAGIKTKADKTLTKNNHFFKNKSPGILSSNSSPIITNNLFTNNQGGISLNHSSPIIANNTFVNSTAVKGTILYCDSASSPVFLNNICYNNTATNGSTIYLNDAASDPNFLYNNLPGGLSSISGVGSGANFSGQFIENMDINPQFTGSDDFSLKATSPCINAGYPGLDSSAFVQFGLPWSDLAGNPRLYNNRIDLGAYEFISDVRTVSGNITENVNWYEDTVKVTGNVNIANGVKVLINRGTVVQFQGRYGFTVNGKIKANGNASQPVIFEAKNPAVGWNGLYYPENSDQDSSFYYNCNFKHALADDGIPAVNFEDNGGLFRIKKGNKVVVSDCEIEDIEAKNNGGAIWIDESSVQIINCLFHHNKAGNQGGAIYAQNCNPLLLNNTLVYNQAANGGSALALQNSDALNYNNIIWFNTATTGNQIQLNDNNSDPDFKFCNIESGLNALSGTGSGDNFSGAWQDNISGNPDFTGTKSANSYALKSTSPCIDKGTPASSGFIFPLYDIDGNPRIYGSRIDIGAFEYTVVGLNGENTPSVLELKQNYPNPFNPSTTIVFTLPNSGYAELAIYNIKGELVKTMVKGVCQAGTQQLTFDGSAFASGMYYYRLTTPNQSIAKKMILLK